MKKEVEAIEEKVSDRSLALEILKELKESSRRWQNAFFALLFILAITIGSFIWFANSYDYVSSIEAIGVYTAVDSDGNIIAQDVTPEQWKLFMEWLNGKNKDNEETN